MDGWQVQYYLRDFLQVQWNMSNINYEGILLFLVFWLDFLFIVVTCTLSIETCLYSFLTMSFLFSGILIDNLFLLLNHPPKGKRPYCISFGSLVIAYSCNYWIHNSFCPNNNKSRNIQHVFWSTHFLEKCVHHKMWKSFNFSL